MLSPAGLRAFTAVVEEGTFTAAAERLHATQSGVSQQVGKLERYLGVPLLVRSAHGASTTPAGRQLYLRAIAILRDLSAAEVALRHYGRGIAGSVVVGLMPAMTRCLSGPVQRSFMAEYPNVGIEVVERTSSELIDAVAKGRIDVAIVPAFDAPDGIRCRAIGTTREVLVQRGRRHKDHMRPVAMREFASLRFILQPEGSIRRERILTRLKAEQVEMVDVLALDSTFATLEFVENSDFATIMPAMAMLPEIEKKTLCVRPIEAQSLGLDLIAIEARRQEPSPIADLLMAAFSDSVRDVNRRVAEASRA